jgi:hypothetical protein
MCRTLDLLADLLASCQLTTVTVASEDCVRSFASTDAVLTQVPTVLPVAVKRTSCRAVTEENSHVNVCCAARTPAEGVCCGCCPLLLRRPRFTSNSLSRCALRVVVVVVLGVVAPRARRAVAALMLHAPVDRQWALECA